MSRALTSCSFIIAAVCCLAIGTAAGQGSITIETSANGAAVTVDVTVTDAGGAVDCDGFHLIRSTVFGSGPGVETRCIPRQVGTTTVHQFVDDLESNRAYIYEVVGMSCFAPCVCLFQSDQEAFSQAFGNFWNSGFRAYVNTGPPELTPVAHGQIVSTGYAYPTHFLNGCPGSGSWQTGASPDAEQYVDSGVDVLVYGQFSWHPQLDAFLEMSHVVTQSCTAAAEPSTWGKVKALYH